MINPYLMVFINLIISSFLIFLIIFYQKIYPKKKINLLFLLILISLLPLISIFRAGSYESGDLSTHAMLSISFYESLMEGDFIPIWGGEMNASYGYPAFQFIYYLPYVIISLIHFLGFSFIASAKIMLAGSFILSGVFMYLWLRKEVKEIAAFTGAIFYLFAPYHLINMHFRVDIGEMLAITFLPLCLLAAKNLIKKESFKWFLIEILSFAFLLLSHPAIALSGFIFLFLYILIIIYNESKNRKKLIKNQIICITTSILLTCFYWLPIMLNLKYTSTHNVVHSVTFVNIQDLILSTWRFGMLFQGPEGQLKFLIGYAQIFVIFISIFLLIKNKTSNKDKRFLLLSLTITATCFFLMLEFSSLIWQNVPFLKSFQFSYRFLGVLIFSTSVIAAFTINNIKKNWVIILITSFAIFSTILNWGNRRNIPEINDNYLQKQIPYTNTNGAGLGQAATVWSDPKNTWAKEIPKYHLEIIEGKGIILQLSRSNLNHVYLIQADTPLKLKENTLYYPGWELKNNGQIQEIKILNSNTPKGVMGFSILKGIHKIEFTFKDTNTVSISKLISIFTGIGIFIAFLSFRKKKI